MPEPMPAHIVEDFVGAELSQDELEAETLRLVPLRHLYGKEASLFDTKWFDYRFLHPARATALFAHFYRQAYKDEMRTRADMKRAPYMEPIPFIIDGIFKVSQRNLSGLWKTRQVADGLGIPYDRYCSYLMRETERRGWQWLPKPSQMYAEELVAIAVSKWLEDTAIRLFLPTDKFYLAENYEEHPYQIDFHKYLFALTEARLNRDYFVARLLFDAKVLPIDIATQHFGKEFIARCAAVHPSGK